MRYYIECYYADGKQILGNGDGQRSMDVRDYKRTNYYKRLAGIVGNPNWMGGRVAFAKVVDASGKVLEVIKPKGQSCQNDLDQKNSAVSVTSVKGGMVTPNTSGIDSSLPGRERNSQLR